MESSIIMENEKVIHGKITIKKIKYNGEIITFLPGKHLKVSYWKYPDDDVIAVEYDFGMLIEEDAIRKDGFLGLDEKSSIRDIVSKTVKFDLEHAFLHPQIDPNYTTLHWALYGWLKDRVTISVDSSYQ